MNANLTYGPPLNTDIVIFRLFVSDITLVMRFI